MAQLSDSFLQELKMKTDIEDVISSYVTLHRKGSTSVGLCPFHNEKTPSFTVYHDTQSFYCFGCSAGGDVVGFVRKIENLDYIDAIKMLASRAGMQMPEDKSYDDTLSKQRRKILEINRETAKFFHSYMMSPEGRKGLEYFLNRGLTQKTISHFGLGYAPDKWDGLLKHLKDKGYSISDMLLAGVIRKGQKGYYDYFRNRVVTPIIDVRGNVIAFGARVLDDSKPKYLNTNETLVYKKTYELFGLNFAKDSGKDSLILCEGYMDVIAMHQAGFTNAVAGCGTALTNEQVRLISRYAKEVYLVYDNDEAGQKALRKAISLFNQTDVRIRIPKLSGGKDPDEIIKTHGRDRFESMLEGASNDIEFAILALRSRYDLSTTGGKSEFATEAVKVLADCTPIEQDLYLSRLSDELGITKQVLNAQLQSYDKRHKKYQQKKQFEKIVDDSIRTSRKESYDSSSSTIMIRAQERIIGLLMLYPDCIKLLDDFDSQRLNKGFFKKVFDMICEKIVCGSSLDLIVFNEGLTQDEMSRLSGIISSCQNSDNPKKEFTDCINAVNREYEKANSQKASTLDDDAFRNMFKLRTDNT